MPKVGTKVSPKTFGAKNKLVINRPGVKILLGGFLLSTQQYESQHMKVYLTRVLPLTIALFYGPYVQATELVMFDSPTCDWCEVWDEEIAPIYGKTDEGQSAPLRRHSIHDELPQDLKHLKGIVYTPTFVLMDQGKEVGRIAGYPGEDFFWYMLDELLTKVPPKAEQNKASKQ